MEIQSDTSHDTETDRAPRIESGIGEEHEPEKAHSGLVKVWKLPEPPPRSNVLEGLVPDGAVTILYGDGGVGKSYLALWIATCVCLGWPIFGRPTEKRPVLYADAEMDEQEFRRRAYQVARGSGLEKPPEGLHYWRLSAPLHGEPTLREAGRKVQESGASFVVVDSLSVACSGMDPKEAREVIPLFKGLQALGTVLAIDHIRSQQVGVPIAASRPFGSVFKHHLARSLVQVTKAQGGGMVLRQTKANFGASSTPLCVGLQFSEDCVKVVPLDADDDRLAGVEDNLTASEKVLHTLSKFKEGTATPREIAEQLDVKQQTVRNNLSALKAKGKVVNLGDGNWKCVADKTTEESNDARHEGLH